LLGKPTKRGGQLAFPDFETGGLSSVCVGDRSVSAVFGGFFAAVTGPLRVVLDSVNGFLQFYFKIFERRRNLPFARNDPAGSGCQIPKGGIPHRS
jgi:hypothetical protein